MKTRRWWILIALVILMIPACNYPFRSTNSQTTQAALNATGTVESINSTAFAESVNLTSTIQAANATQELQAVDVTATAEADNATAFALSANATLSEQAANATAQAMAADATAIAESAIATAQAEVPQQPPPLQPPPIQPPPPVFPPPQPPPPVIPPSAIRLSFASGATSTSVDGTLRRGESISYVLRAGKGQTMMASIYAPHDDLYLGVIGLADGFPLLRPAAGQTQFTGNLPGTQDYLLTVVSPNEKSSYTLDVIIPARISFNPGAISATVRGFLAGGNTNYYLARASRGQTMRVKITSPYNDVLLTIYGISDGIPLVRSASGATQWNGVLPGTQDYMIEATSTGDATNYNLEVIIQ